MNSTPNATEPSAGSPAPIIEPVTIRPITRPLSVVASSAAASWAHRPTTVARIRSLRPASSSARVCRMTVSSAASPIITGTNPARQTTSSPRLSPESGP